MTNDAIIPSLNNTAIRIAKIKKLDGFLVVMDIQKAFD